MLKRLAQAEFILASAIFATIVLLVFIAAFMRAFGQPLMWSVDLAQLLFVWLCFFGAARTMRKKGHLGVDLFVAAAPHRFRLVIETLVCVVFLAMLAVLAVLGYELTLMNIERIYGDSQISYAFVTIAVPVGFVMLGGAILYNIVDAWRRRGDQTVLVYSQTDVDAEPPREV
ncbi:TRAP transporter small permease [Thalassospira sp.]|uniref:TRAP transporter small permease n=1 Tax=Thalassospira sp. TaxID=1912094 RepID=UPI002734FC2E|nr:TRAP transporter small permease [Thalassospira sp.]MDP2698338.1 TRAP transporter small permease [Thalassospira sp.]